MPPDLDLHNAAIARLEAELAAAEVRERQKAQSYAELERMYQATIEDEQKAVVQSAAEVVRAAQAGLDAYALYEAMSEAVTCCRGIHYVDIEGEAEAEACDLWIDLDDKLRAFENGEHPGTRLFAELIVLRAVQPTTTSPFALVPADAIDAPRVPRSKQTAFTPAQEQALRAAVSHTRYEALYDLALLQGLRRGELLGLLIGEYDPRAGTIKVSGQIQTIGGVTKRHGTPKTANGERELPLTPRQVELVEAQLAYIRDQRAKLGMAWHEHGLLFPSETGTPIIPRNLSRHYYKALKRASLPRMPLHRLRHTAATRLDSESVRASEACKMAILGHGPASVTGGYIHVSLEEKRAALIRSEAEMLRRAA